MGISEDDITQLKRYLIGALEGAEDCEVGERLLTDGEYFAHVAIVEDELIDDYLAGRLSGDERSLFEGHFMVSRSHKEKLRFAQALRKYAQAESRSASAAVPASGSKRLPRLFSLSSFKVVLTAAVVMLAALTGYRTLIHKSDLQKGQDLLKGLYKTERPMRSRIAMLDWAPFEDTRAGRSKQPGIEEQDARLLLQHALQDDPGPASEHAFGAFCLATRDFDEAINNLRLAVSHAPNNPTYRSDLGAALLEKGKYDRLHGRAAAADDELRRGLEEFEHALSSDADFKPALFNRALCLEAMERWREAEDAWGAYLAKDPNSQWAMEAKQNLDSLRQK